MTTQDYQSSRLTGKQVPHFYIHSDTRYFKDTSGRTLILRGVNLSGSAKIPRNHPQHVLHDFWESAEQDGQPQQSNPYIQPSSSVASNTDGSSSFNFDTQNLTPTTHDTPISPNMNNNHNPGISYIGQNLNLEDGSADIHLTRLRQWGFNCLRFVTVWEALEHQGPGQYDDQYMEYVVAMLRKCKEFGFRVYMDPHQDLFSRFCGGSGAPLWTLHACGLNPRNFTVTGSAYLQSEWPHPDTPDPSSFPAMIWATNYNRLACQTVNTMFWAGRDYAPKCIIDGVNIQDYLQYHFLEAYRRLAMKIESVGDLLDETVIGWDSINEPNHGYLGLHNLMAIPDEVPLRIGPTPTGYQGLKMGMGMACKLENYKFGPIGPQRDGTVIVDPKGKRAWLDPSAEPDGLSGYGWRRDPGWLLGTCIWAQHGIWDPETDTVLQPNYFNQCRQDITKPADFAALYWRPHLNAYCHMIRQIHPEAILFVHPPVFEIPPNLSPTLLPILEHRSVFSSHFYDGLTLVTKHWNWFNADALGILRGKYPSVVFGLKIGETAIRKCMRAQLGVLKQDGLEKMGEFPTMMGEIGIPYDLDKSKAYKDGDYGSQIKAMDASLNACDGENMLNWTLWTYCPSNSHQWGDLWNGEDLSLWSSDDAMYQGSKYAEKSSRHGKVLGRPFQYNYGAQSAGPTPNASALTLNHRTNQCSETDLIRKGVYTPVAGLGSGSDSSLDLNLMNLNDGARALPAFCRPFPVATVGIPTYFNFDIHTASFELTVEVDTEKDSGSEWGNEELPTEIYVPAVHFGSSNTDSAGLQRRNNSENDTNPEHWPAGSSSDASLPLPGGGGQDRTSLNDTGTTQAVHFDPKRFKDTLQLEVDVSAGRWETEGQILRWYYPRKPINGQQKATYTLKVRRKFGPILWAGGQSGICSSDSEQSGPGKISSSGGSRLGVGFHRHREPGEEAPSFGRTKKALSSLEQHARLRAIWKEHNAANVAAKGSSSFSSAIFQ
ncbi:hypothetical protein Pst134EA_013397 [Puccinia striiformis f. sp. tritici]|uniref:Glycoside hydrolase family 5 domain-containing protein n=2 Tax=Puccinia striiformis f. sp. tritici PST-78 TaxID=1165861 RepID=A0A0L0VIR4_9BASI|nr:hypothetical protein Pst134EA_013397 [Puccinia striiformis f. sp. tritici]KAH9465514.1 hypothetical protein Pst134EA_013397 [Puccinia striiformis f. sp. tritici]KAI9603773.1 hypothetical protein H4Q26_003376 [Puccinia striiformis f. sp. tritici PST-130]KNE98874.1 hypothetical protein PSTG_07895 [Puccinia striiformis f. sp. tritici PST-78]